MAQEEYPEVDYFTEAEHQYQAWGTLVASPLWHALLEPYLKAQLSRKLKALTTTRDDDQINRGWIAAMQWALTLPTDSMKFYEDTKARNAQEEDNQAREDVALKYGAGGRSIPDELPREPEDG